MYPPKFDYHRAQSVSEAVSLLSQYDGAKLLAGGHSLLPVMKLRLSDPGVLIDIGRISELKGITETGNGFRIGALTPHAAVAADSRLPNVLTDAASMIGDPQVRNRGTLGGSLANSDPAADYPAAVLGFGAVIRTDRREIPADDYFLGLFETALEPDEIVQAVRFPAPKRAAYAKFPNPASRYAIVGVMVAETGNGVRVAVTGAGPCAFRATAFEDALNRDFSAAALEGLAIDAADLNSDLHASAEYRAHLVSVMAKRAVQAASG